MFFRFLLVALSGLAAASGALAAEDRIATVPISGRTRALNGSVHPKAQAANDRGPADPALRIQYATLLLKPADGLEEFLAAQQNPSSPDFHRWLTPEGFADRFGLSGNDVNKLVTWLKGQGFTVHDVARGRHWITFSGNAGQVSHAFHTEIHRFLVDGAMHFAAAQQVRVPVEFANVVAAVRGLDDFRLQALYRRASAAAPDYNSGNSHYLAPDDIAAIYNVAQLYNTGIDGTGQKIAIIGQTDIDPADIRAFRKTYNLPANDPQIMVVGPDPGTTGDEVEADLDLEWAGAVARNASLIYVNSLSVDISAQYAVDQNAAPVMTFSYGVCEQEALETLRPIAQQANAQGITWLAASGDAAAATCDRDAVTPQASKGLSVSYPSSIPEITSVGGTEFNENGGAFWGPNGTNRGSAISYIPEIVWNDSATRNSVIGGGGGASGFFAKPYWQTGLGVPNDNARDVPDISFSSSADHDGYIVVSEGKSLIIGGTSVASPVFAGMVALVNHSLMVAKKVMQPGLGNINPALYRFAQSQNAMFHDVIGGDNKVPCEQGSPNCVNGTLGYAATPGYDLATGLGSVDAFRLAIGWNSGNPSTVVVSGPSAAIAVGDQVSLTATVQASGSPSGSITFLSADLNLGTVPLTGGAASLKVAGALVAAGNGAVSALYSGDANFAPAGGSTIVPLAVVPGSSYIVPSVNPNPVRQSGSLWPYVLTLTEKSDVPTTITVFTIDGVDNLGTLKNTSFTGIFSFSVSLAGRLTGPTTRVFHFGGVDGSGQTWAADLSVPFIGPAGPSISPGVTLAGSPSAIQQNMGGDPSCQWVQRLVVKETGGFSVVLRALTVNGSNVPGLSQIFGTTRLAPFGTLSGSVCLSGITPPAQQLFIVTGTSEVGSAVGASWTGLAAAPSLSAATMSASPTVAYVNSGGATVNLNFAGGAPAWSASITIAGHANWLSVSPASGTGSGTLNLQANTSGLSNGVYNALLSIQAIDSLPQTLQIPVAVVVGGSSNISIGGTSNAASSLQSFAPGMWMAIYGNNLAPATQLAASLPLPLTLAGVSATVNGVAAPLSFVGPRQVNLQIPYETSAGTAFLEINNNGSVASYALPVSPTAPGIFNTSLTGTPGQTIVAYITGEGDVTPTLATGTVPKSGTKLANLPQPRQAIGLTVGGEPAAIAFDGVVSLVGVTQINFTIPADIGLGVHPVVVTVGGVKSAPVNLTVTAAP